MSDVPFIAVSGAAATRLTIHVPGTGPWFCDADLVDDTLSTTGEISITIGDTFSAVGTVDQNHDGTFALSRKTRIVGGAGGWSNALAATAYRNDAGVQAALVAQDAARAVGETIASFAGAQPVLGTHYVRDAGTASKTIEDVANGAPWWVDFQGMTHVGARVGGAADPKNVRLLEYDARSHVATLAVDDLTGIDVGYVITDDRLAAPLTVTAYEIHVETNSIRVIAWCDIGTQAQIADVMRSIVQRVIDSQLFGKYRYRVVTIDPGPAGRLNLQSVKPSQGVPDILSVSMAAAGGIHVAPKLGSS